MKIKCIAGAILISVALASCTGNNGEIEYDIDPVDSHPKTLATLRKIDTEVDFGYPEAIDFISDSLMVVFDRNVNDYAAHVIDIDGRYIGSFGRKGHGEGELGVPYGISYNERMDSAFIYDFMLERLVGFDLGRVIRGEAQMPSVIQFDINTIPGQKYRFSGVKRCPDGKMLGFEDWDNRIVLMQNGEAQAIYREYPLVDPDFEINRGIWNNSGGRKSISPDGSKLVISTYIGALFETFDISDGEISSRVIKGFYRPIYDPTDHGGIPRSVQPDFNNHVAGFRVVVVSDDDFVTVLDGPESKRIDEILTFDYDGNITNRIVVDNGFIDKIGRNSKGEIYCIAWDRDFQEQNLYKVELTE